MFDIFKEVQKLKEGHLFPWNFIDLFFRYIHVFSDAFMTDISKEVRKLKGGMFKNKGIVKVHSIAYQVQMQLVTSIFC